MSNACKMVTYKQDQLFKLKQKGSGKKDNLTFYKMKQCTLSLEDWKELCAYRLYSKGKISKCNAYILHQFL